ncbi:hypothetical protein C0995_010536 [Termitomyces sp. Mi166|nr:hypothetical protein C0995_010536 [Termitomyces sp. Mi166\
MSDMSGLGEIEGDIIYPALQDSVTSDLRSKVVSKAMLWAGKGNRPIHWRTSFAFAEVKGKSSPEGISFDMFQPTYHANNHPNHLDVSNHYGSLSIQPRASGKLASKNRLVSVDIPLTPGITAGDIIDLVTVQNKMQDYIYHPDGSGCLYWQLTLLGRLCERQWCRDFQEKLLESISYAQTQDGGHYANAIVWPPVKGTFYSQ